MREGRASGRRSSGRSGGTGQATTELLLRLWAPVARRPVDALAALGAAALGVVIIVNAMVMQAGPSPAPIFAKPASPPPQAGAMPADVTAAAAPKPAEAAVSRPPPGQRAMQPVPARRADPIGDLIGSSVGSPARVMAVQRVLAEFGYGQIKPTGALDAPTMAAIKKFEAERKLPVTGRLTDRLLAELAALAGHPIE